MNGSVVLNGPLVWPGEPLPSDEERRVAELGDTTWGGPVHVRTATDSDYERFARQAATRKARRW